MTDGTTGGDATRSSVDIGPSVDDLFGEIEEEPLESDSADRADDGGSDGIEDQTASDVFNQFRREAAGEFDVDDVLGEESPEDLIVDADEEPSSTPEDDSLFDEEAFDELLLTGRRKEDEFLWIETKDADEADDLEEGIEDDSGEAPETDSEDRETVADDSDLTESSTPDSTEEGSVSEPGTGELEADSEVDEEAGVGDDTEEDADSETDAPDDADSTESSESVDEAEESSPGLLGRVRSTLRLR